MSDKESIGEGAASLQGIRRSLQELSLNSVRKVLPDRAIVSACRAVGLEWRERKIPPIVVVLHPDLVICARVERPVFLAVAQVQEAALTNPDRVVGLPEEIHPQHLAGAQSSGRHAVAAQPSASCKGYRCCALGIAHTLGGRCAAQPACRLVDITYLYGEHGSEPEQQPHRRCVQAWGRRSWHLDAVGRRLNARRS